MTFTILGPGTSDPDVCNFINNNVQVTSISPRTATTMYQHLIHEILSFDIFTEIFNYYCKSDVPHPAHNLELVCKRWRDMALDMPSLWSEMTLEVGKKGKPFSNIQESAIKWLNRSEGVPFKLIVKCKRASLFHDSGLVLFPTFLPLLYTRLESLEIYATNTMIETLCRLPLDTIEFPSLKTLKIKPLYDTRIANVSISLDPAARAFSRCPSLKSLVLKHSNRFDFLKQWEQLFPWSQLTSLSLVEGVPVNVLLAILAGCPNLVTCHIFHIWSGRSRDLIHPTPQRHPHLKSISLRSDDDELEWVLKLWSQLPSLESLTTVSMFAYDQSVSFSIFLCNLYRSEPFPLRELNISRDVGGTANFLGFLSCVPTLESLTLRYTDLLYDPYFIESITIDDTKGDNLIPRLTYFDACERSIGSLKTMYRFLYSRRESMKCSPLQRVVVSGFWSSFEDVLGKIKNLTEGGLHIDMPWVYSPARNWPSTSIVPTGEEEEDFMFDSLFDAP